MRSWISGGRNSVKRMRGSRSDWRASFLMISHIRSHICLRNLLPKLPRRQEEHGGRVDSQKEGVGLQNSETHTFQKYSFQDGDKVAGRHQTAERLDWSRHAFDRIYESG